MTRDGKRVRRVSVALQQEIWDRVERLVIPDERSVFKQACVYINAAVQACWTTGRRLDLRVKLPEGGEIVAHELPFTTIENDSFRSYWTGEHVEPSETAGRLLLVALEVAEKQPLDIGSRELARLIVEKHKSAS